MLVSLGWVMKAVLDVFMFIFDTTVYGLAIIAINVFNGIARLDLFSTDAGAALYSDIARRLYAIIGIIMIFFFAYQLVLLVINPDGDTKTSTGMVKTTITSLIMIAFFPTLFKYMAEFQEHVLTEGTITAIVLGQGASGGNPSTSGRNTAVIVYLSMYHPGDGGYESLVDSNTFDENGFPKQKTAAECAADSGASEETCQLWVDAYDDFIGGGSFGGITAFTINDDLTETINEEGGSTYYAVIIVICGAVLVWFYFSYAIDLGYRTVKLGFLQIISPAPLVMRIFPKTAKTFDKWKHEMIKTYLEVFVRVFIVAFIIAIIQKLPAIIGAIFQSLFSQSDWWCIPFALVAMIFGLLKFGKELPKLVKDVFDNGSGLFSGIDWKPGFSRRLEQGADDVVGFGKGIAKRAAQAKADRIRRTKRLVNAPLSAARGAMKIAGGAKGIVSGAGAAAAANHTSLRGGGLKGAAKHIKTIIPGAIAGAKAGSAAGGTWTRGTSVNDIMNKAKIAAGTAGGKVETPSLKSTIDSYHKQFDTDAVQARNMQVSNIKSESSEAKKRIEDQLGITDAVSKITTAKANDLAEYTKHVAKGEPVGEFTIQKLDEKGNVIGTETLTAGSSEEMIKLIKKTYDNMSHAAVEKGYDTYKDSDGFADAVAENLGAHSDALKEAQALNVSDTALQNFTEKLKVSDKLLAKMGWSADDIANNYVKLKAENDKIVKNNASINAQIEGIDLNLDSIKDALQKAAPDSSTYAGDTGQDMLQAEAEKILRENQTKVADLQSQIQQEKDMSKAKQFTIDDITHLIDQTRQDVKNGNADPSLLAELHELTASIQKNTNTLTAFETKANEDARNAAKNDSSSNSGGDKK